MLRLLYIWYFLAFSIYQDTPEIPERAFFGSFHWKIFQKERNLWKGSPVFPLETFPMELRVPFMNFTRFDQFQAVHDHIFGEEIWRLLLLPRWLFYPRVVLYTNARCVMASLQILKR